MKQLTVISAMLALLLLTGCREKDKYALVFSHSLHVTENEMACDDCHGKTEAGGFAGLGHGACADCHDDVIATKEISTETCGVCHRQKDLSAIKERPAVRKAGGSFAHTAALDGQCGDCHGDVMAAESDSVPLLTARDVIRLREASHAGGKPCETCHRDMDPEVPTADHDVDWVRRHGFRAEQDAGVCSVCHQEESCRECHQATMPTSHNNLWRLKTHGVEASWDRQRCQLCHEEDFCVACHAETRPRSHSGAWSQTHCYQCHTSESMGAGCSTCHEAALDTHPNPHGADWRRRHCNQCHPGTPEAEQCRLCHPGGLDNHPDPHRSSWLTRHCDECHPGTYESERCGLCHPGGIDGHPDPHGAGWRKSHCFSCHTGAGNDECSVCHSGGGSVRVHADGAWPWWHDPYNDQSDCFICHHP